LQPQQKCSPIIKAYFVMAWFFVLAYRSGKKQKMEIKFAF